MSDKSGKKQGATIIDAGLGELDKVRGILFGRQMDAYEQRFAQLEQSLEKNVAAMQKRADEQIDKLKTAVDEAVQTLGDQVQKESVERNDAFSGLESSLQSSIQETEKTLSQALLSAEDHSQEEVIELKMLFEKQNNSTVETIDQLKVELVEMFKQQTSNLQSDKVDRESLAMMLDEITLRLRKKPD